MTSGHGGARPGSGRKKGSGKQRKSAERAIAFGHEGETPAEFMLKLMRDETRDIQLRADMAKAVAPYVHPRLSNAEVGNAQTEDGEILPLRVIFENDDDTGPA